MCSALSTREQYGVRWVALRAQSIFGRAYIFDIAMSHLFGCMDCPPVPGAILDFGPISSGFWSQFSWVKNMFRKLVLICMGETYFQEFGPRFFDMSSASGYMDSKYFQEFGTRFLTCRKLLRGWGNPCTRTNETWPYN